MSEFKGQKQPRRLWGQAKPLTNWMFAFQNIHCIIEGQQFQTDRLCKQLLKGGGREREEERKKNLRQRYFFLSTVYIQEFISFSIWNVQSAWNDENSVMVLICCKVSWCIRKMTNCESQKNYYDNTADMTL